MRKIALLLGFTATMAAVTARAEGFPKELVYRFYAGGQYLGKCEIKSGEKDGAYTFDSRSEMRNGEFYQNLECYSEFDKETLAPRYYSYHGTKAGAKVGGSLDFTPGQISGDIEVNGDSFPSKLAVGDHIVLFENYVLEHQTILLATLARSSDPLMRFSIFFPSDFTPAPCVAMVESDVELPLRPKPTVCRKYSVTIQPSETFYGYFDPEQQVAVYMDYPRSSIEIFLESAWGDNPPLKYKTSTLSDPGKK